MRVRRIAFTAVLVAGLVPLPAGGVLAAAAPPRSLCAPPADTVGPVATSATFGRPTIDIDSGSRKQSITIHASDTSGDGPASGVASVSVDMKIFDFVRAPSLTLVSGTPRSGTWRETFTVSKYARPRQYSLTTIVVTDAAGNYQAYDIGDDGPDSLALHPADNPSFTITGTRRTRPPHTPAGHLRSFSISPTHVDTTSTPQPVHVAARFTGPPPKTVFFELHGRRSRHVIVRYVSSSLTDHDGRWTGSVQVPRWLGRETLRSLLVAHFPPRSKPLDRYYESARYFDRHHIPSRVTVVSSIDRTRPTLTSLSLSPDPVDTTAGAQHVTVTAGAADTGSGVAKALIAADPNNGGPGLRFHLSQTAQGTWVGAATVPRCLPSGTYPLSARLRDVAGNIRYYTTAQLAKANLPSTVVVTSDPGDVVAPEVTSAAAHGTQLSLHFSEGVTHVDTSTLTVFPLAPRSTRYRSDAPVTQIVCSDGTATVNCSGASGLVTSAVLTVPAMSPGHRYQVWANLNQVTPQLSDGNRNPLDWNDYAAQVHDS